MAELTSGSVKIPGLGNGTNFHEMIDQLEKIEMSHALQLNKWKKDWQTRLDAFKQVQAAMVEYSAALKKISSVDKFMLKTVNNSNSGVCTATATGKADNTSHTIQVKQKATNSYISAVFNIDDKLKSINNTGSEQTFTFYLGGMDPVKHKKTLKIPPNCTLEGLKNLINQEYGNPKGDALGVRASIIDIGGGKQMLQLYSTKTGANTDIHFTIGDNAGEENDFWGISNANGPTYITDNLVPSKGQDAWVRIDGWPTPPDGPNPGDPPDENHEDGWLKLSNNTINHIEGLNITITGEGKSVIDIDLDTEGVRENIMTFVDATNELRTLMKELTDYNATKAVATDPEYAESQFDMQKGGVLQGNYGMQLMMSKMKTHIMSKPFGFEYLEKNDAGEIIKGDTFASLAQIGIKTDAEQGSPTYGLLVFEDNISVLTGDNKVEMITFEDALRMNAQNIGELFAADCAPSVDGTNFGYNSHVAGFTKAGAYDVTYKVDANGVIYDAWIGDKKAHVDGNQISLRGQDSPPNYPGDGLILDIYDTTPTDPTPAYPSGNPPHTGTVRLKSGFLPELVSMVDKDFLDPDSGDEDTTKGTLSVLITQYQNIIDGINEKIAKEDERLIKWRRMTEQRFANLEATLKLYSGLQAQLESSVNSLSSSSKKN